MSYYKKKIHKLMHAFEQTNQNNNNQHQPNKKVQDF